MSTSGRDTLYCVLAVVAPGQGSQKPGMFVPWLDVPGVAEALSQYSDLADLDLTRLGTTAGPEEIKDTAVTQPLVVAAALLAAERLRLPLTAVVAGHSVGELAAGALAEVWAATEAVQLAALRGAAMSRACALTPTGMSAVMGGDPAVVLASLAERDLIGANVNGAGQIVAAGSSGALAALAAAPPAGTRVIPLPVAGAFHTHFMEPARVELEAAVIDLAPRDPVRTLLTNADGSVVGEGKEYLRLLVNQVTSPVRWDECMASMRRLGVTGILELPPAGALIGLARRELKGVATLAIKGPEDLDTAATFLEEHAA